ncbi:hypothetical protein DPMN_015686 [Dreissena polymorpha]|uniref:DNTTIP1 n=2 Tax=Dreissena polymorpha TaxID=45954 RepID=A0A9D4NE45_DREPO|nr:hypothetical protein DPMN_015686 [Dreissena polymorpha]
MDRKQQERRSISPARAGNVRPVVAVSTGWTPTMNILSTILRSPHPNMGPVGPEIRGSVRPNMNASIRGMSPIRIITSLPGSGSVVSPKSSLSPSRTPTTLPPKKSLSPSRPIYVESISTNPPTQIVTQFTAQGQSRPSQGQGQLLSHLPLLAQKLQKEGLSHEKIFQQYKGQESLQAVSQPSYISQKLAGQVVQTSPGPRSQGQPLPAHQRVLTPPPVAVIRRTPSPAHMPQGEDTRARWSPEKPRSHAVNLVKPHEEQIKAQNQEFRPADLNKVMNQAQQQIRSQILQGGLSPITPADPVQRPWSHDHASLIQNPANSHPLITQSLTGVNPRTSHVPIRQHVSPTSGSVGGVSSASNSSSAASVISNVQVTGFMPVVLPSQSRSMHVSSQNVPVVSSFVSLSRPSMSSSSKSYQTVETVLLSRALTSGAVTQAGPPNITISNRSTIPTQEKIAQKIPRNPFTFPATPPVSLSNERPAFQTSQSNLVIDEDLPSEKKRHRSDDMPQLSPVGKMKREVDENDEELVPIPYAFNMRIQTLANFPNNPHNRPTYRATSVAIDKAKRGCITNPAKSLDIIRENLQKSINKEIDAVIQTYMDKFFKLGIKNIRLNNGEASVTDDHIHAVRRQILEEAKKMYMSVTTESNRQSVSPARDLSGSVSDTGSSGRRSALSKRRHPSDTDSEASHRPAALKKKKGRLFVNLTGRSTPSKLAIQQAKREGPKFEPERLNEETMFVMGSKANKAMGFGATRGRLYMKHPDLFKYNGDQDDKTWLYEHQHMPATGGKSYLIVLNDVRELALSDEYKDTPGINVETLTGFTVPMWMIEKMQAQMVSMRTDLPKQAKYRSRSATPNVTDENLDVESPPKELPFACFSSPKQSTMLEASPAEDDMDFLTTESDNRDTP